MDPIEEAIANLISSLTNKDLAPFQIDVIKQKIEYLRSLQQQD